MSEIQFLEPIPSSAYSNQARMNVLTSASVDSMYMTIECDRLDDTNIISSKGLMNHSQRHLGDERCIHDLALVGRPGRRCNLISGLDVAIFPNVWDNIHSRQFEFDYKLMRLRREREAGLLRGLKWQWH